MRFKTNMTADTINRYNAMNWNHGEEVYCLAPCGDCWEEVLRDAYEEDPEYLLDAGVLEADTEWQIVKHEDMLEEDEAGAAHSWYLEGCRDERTMKGMAEWRKGRSEIAAYRRDLKRWLASVEECEPHWMDTDDIDIQFGRSGKARA